MASHTVVPSKQAMLAAARKDYIRCLETLVIPNFVRILYRAIFGFLLGFQVFDLLELDRKSVEIEIDALREADIAKLFPLVVELAEYNASNDKWVLKAEIRKKIDEQGGLPKSDNTLLRDLREWTQDSREERQQIKTGEEVEEEWRELITWIKREVHEIVLKKLGGGDIREGEKAVGLENAFYTVRQAGIDGESFLPNPASREKLSFVTRQR